MLRHGALALGISLVGSLLAFLAQVGLARAMNAQQYGVYAYAFAWVSLLSTIGTVGFEPTLLRFVSVLREQGEFAALRAVIRYAERCSVLVSAALVLAAATAIWLLRERLSAELMVTFAIGLLVIPATALMRLRSSVVRVFGRLALSLIPGSSLRELMLVIAAVAMLLGALPIAYSAVAMGVVLLASVLGLAAVSAGVQRSLLPESHACAIATSISATPPEGAARAWLRPALFLLVFITTNLLLKRTDILVIGWLLGTEQAGVYAVAIYIAGLVVLPVTAIGTVFAPVVAALHAEQRMGVLQEKASAAAWWGIAAGVIPGLALFIFAPIWLGMIGDAYVAASDVLRILVVGNLVAAAVGPVHLLMTMTGDERRAATLHVAFAVVDVPLVLLFVHWFGLQGGAMATLLIVLCFKCALVLLVYRRIGVWSAPVWIKRRDGSGPLPSDMKTSDDPTMSSTGLRKSSR